MPNCVTRMLIAGALYQPEGTMFIPRSFEAAGMSESSIWDNLHRPECLRKLIHLSLMTDQRQGRRLSLVRHTISGRETCLWDIALTTHLFVNCTALPSMEKCIEMSICDWVDRVTSSLPRVKHCQDGRSVCRVRCHMPRASKRR